MRTLRSMFDKKYIWGHLVCSASCGCILGAAPLWESEGMEEVHRALTEIFPDPARRPQLLIYDLACRRLTFLENHPDAGAWAGTQLVVDRYVRIVYFLNASRRQRITFRTPRAYGRACGTTAHIGCFCFGMLSQPWDTGVVGAHVPHAGATQPRLCGAGITR